MVRLSGIGSPLRVRGLTGGPPSFLSIKNINPCASEKNVVGATKALVPIFWVVVTDRAVGLGVDLGAQVMKVDNEILQKNVSFLSVAGRKVKNFL